MRNVGLQWRNLADGLSRVEALEARFRGHWPLGSRRLGVRGTKPTSEGPGDEDVLPWSPRSS